jgi:glycosyltransferase involved in cell wall biosynthesis
VKRLGEAVRLIAKLRERGIPAELDIYGPDCGDGRAVRQAVGEHGLERAVRIHGPLERGQLPDIARDRSFFVLLSKQEGAAISALEAMHLGLVPIVTSVGAMRDYARFGHAHSSVQATAEWVAQLLSDPERSRELSRGAADYAAGHADHAASLRAAIQASLLSSGSRGAYRVRQGPEQTWPPQ